MNIFHEHMLKRCYLVNTNNLISQKQMFFGVFKGRGKKTKVKAEMMKGWGNK